jgi:hypothetical protein
MTEVEPGVLRTIRPKKDLTFPVKCDGCKEVIDQTGDPQKDNALWNQRRGRDSMNLHINWGCVHKAYPDALPRMNNYAMQALGPDPALASPQPQGKAPAQTPTQPTAQPPAQPPAQPQEQKPTSQPLTRQASFPAHNAPPAQDGAASLQVTIPRDYAYFEAERILVEGWSNEYIVKNVTLKGGTYAREGEAFSEVARRAVLTVMAVVATIPTPEKGETANAYLSRLNALMPDGVEASVPSRERAKA